MKRFVQSMFATMAVVLMVQTGTGSAHTGWSVEGMISVGTQICGNSATCLAWYNSGNPNLSSSCAEELAVAEGSDSSVVKLPDDLGNHWAIFTFTTSAPFLPGSSIHISFHGGTSGCRDILRDVAVEDGSRLSVPGGARWAVVTATLGARVEWKLTGMLH